MVSENGKNSLILFLMAMVWGFAFAFQSLGADALQPFTFFAFRNYFAVTTMVVLFVFFRKEGDDTDTSFSIRWGLLCGILEFAGSIVQQVAIGQTTAANCSFITASYVILVPLIGLLFGNHTRKKVLFCVGLEVIGLYFLCIKDGFRINPGDIYSIFTAIIFALHIILIDKGGKRLDSVVMCFAQFVVCAVLSTAMMFIFEMPINYAGVRTAIIPLVYTGVFSSAIAITLQVAVQKELDPTVASLIMCLESVFGAVGGWIILNETLNGRELFGCFIMFAAIVISQLPDRKIDLKIFSRFVK